MARKKTVGLEAWLTTTTHPAVMQSSEYAVATDGCSAAGIRTKNLPVEPESISPKAEHALEWWMSAAKGHQVATVETRPLEAICKAFPANKYTVAIKLRYSHQAPVILVRHLASGLVLEAEHKTAPNGWAKGEDVCFDARLVLRAAQFLGAAEVTLARADKGNSLGELAVLGCYQSLEPEKWALVAAFRA